jgi:hypothetical protein
MDEGSGSMAFDRKCGTCELLERSSTSGLSSWGKCPHRSGWVRTHDDACPHHGGAQRRKRIFVRAIMALQVSAASAGYGTFVVMDIRNGTLYSHVVVGAVGLIILAFGLVVWKFDLLSEDAKFKVLDDADPKEEQEHQWWLDDK